MTIQRRGNQAFTLLELVIVVVIIGIIAAIAIPRISRGSAEAADSALVGNLAVLRNAIDLFAAEHNGGHPTLADFENQLTKCSDASGGVKADGSRDATHIYGPYLRRMLPLPVGTYKGKTGTAAPATVPPVAEVATGSVGWLYDATTGQVWANDAANMDR